MAVLKEMPKRVLAALKKTSGRAIFQRIGDTIVFRTIWAALAIIDRPFAGLSPTAKKYIGIIGIITIICGILSLVLPGMLASNPYLDMVTNP